MISRRAFLASSAALAVAPVLPAPVAAKPVIFGVDLAAGPDLAAYIVGTPGEFDWQVIKAFSPEEAFADWCVEHTFDDEPRAFHPDCVQRMPRWDGQTTVSSGDWIDAGWGHCCERCGSETCPDSGGRNVAGEAVCEECLTIVDRAICDPDNLVEELANRIDDDGEDDVRQSLNADAWEAVSADIWPRAVAMAAGYRS